MHRYVLCIAISAVVWIINGRWLAHAVRQRIASEIYIHTGLGLFFTLLVVELALGALRLWPRFDITWIQIFGFALYVYQGIFLGSKVVQPEPYISHFNESAVQVLNSHREQRSVEEKFPPQVLTSFPAVKVPQATRRRVEEIQS